MACLPCCVVPACKLPDVRLCTTAKGVSVPNTFSHPTFVIAVASSRYHQITVPNGSFMSLHPLFGLSICLSSLIAKHQLQVLSSLPSTSHAKPFKHLLGNLVDIDGGSLCLHRLQNWVYKVDR